MGSRLSRQSSPEGDEDDPPGARRRRRRRRRRGGGQGEAAAAAAAAAGQRLRRGGEFQLASLLLRSQKLPGMLRKRSPAPYARRVGWIREIQAALQQRQREQALLILRLLRKDLGLEGTFLKEVLYKKAAFLNLVDPISHDLLMSLARDLQCPQKEYDFWKSSDRICRQLIYHLTPHSAWQRQGVAPRTSQSSLKSSLQKKLSHEAMDLSGIPLSTRDIHRMAYYLQNHGGSLHTVDLSFTDLTDEMLQLLLPFLWPLPSLTHLALNGNRLTRATVKEVTDAVKDPSKFPLLAWIDLGNNVDVSSMPQPLLVGLRRRLSQQTTLPTIYEALDCDSERSSEPEEEGEEMLLHVEGVQAKADR